MSRKTKNPIIIRPDTTIGNSAAETDEEFLFDCFLDHPALSSISNVRSSKLILSGRTGTGKTALLRMIERNQEHTSNIELEDMALDYVANSDIIRFLQSLDIDLDLFFQVLWKHVLCIEHIRNRYSVTNEEKSTFIFRQIGKYFASDDRRKEALKYLGEWEGKFWITMDENIKEITQKFENDIDAEFGVEVRKFTSRAGYARRLGVEKKAELVSRAKKFVNARQLAELNKVLDLLSEYDSSGSVQKYYILIDRLDEKWVDEGIRFRLIRALIESLKSFRKIQGLKIIVSIRTDVLERVILENKDLGFQREKYDDYFLRILWKKEQLKELVQKRINFLYRRQYTSENVFFEDVFPSKIANKDPFDYIIERTLLRPRDVISFVNLCLQHAQGGTEVHPKHIKEAEAEYSRLRYQALQNEWKSAFPSLGLVCSQFSQMADRFPLRELASKEFIEKLVLSYDLDNITRYDPLHASVSGYMRDINGSAAEKIARNLASVLYRIGAIGIKLGPNERYIYSHQDSPILNEESIGLDNKIHIHPMLHKALGIDRSSRENRLSISRPLVHHN